MDTTITLINTIHCTVFMVILLFPSCSTKELRGPYFQQIQQTSCKLFCFHCWTQMNIFYFYFFFPFKVQSWNAKVISVCRDLQFERKKRGSIYIVYWNVNRRISVQKEQQKKRTLRNVDPHLQFEEKKKKCGCSRFSKSYFDGVPSVFSDSTRSNCFAWRLFSSKYIEHIESIELRSPKHSQLTQ